MHGSLQLMLVVHQVISSRTLLGWWFSLHTTLRQNREVRDTGRASRSYHNELDQQRDLIAASDFLSEKIKYGQDDES